MVSKFFRYVFLVCITWTNAAMATKKVLLLNSYHPQYKWTSELTRGVQQSLISEIEPENLFIEFMDQRRFIDDPIYDKKLINLLNYKYHLNKPDVVITSDDSAFYFMLEYGDTLFPNIPVVFCGVNVFNPKLIANKQNITGIAEGMDIQGNLELITQLQPDVSNIVILGDTTGLGLKMINQSKKIKKLWQQESDVKIDIWDSFSLKELYQKVSQLSQNTAVLMLAIHKDKLGQYFSFEEHLPVLSEKSKAPVYGMWGALMIGNGVVGGMMNDPFEHGFNTAQMALKILSGTPASQIPYQRSAVYKPRLDFLQLSKFNLKDYKSIENSIIYNQPMSVYKENRLFINTVITVIIFLLLLISMLMRNIYQRRAAQMELKNFNQKLESTVKMRTVELEQRNKELETATASMKKLAHTDILTGLKNRRAAGIDIPAYINRYNISYKPFVIAMLDIDFFKKVNDNFGHQIGDSVLESISKALASCLRPEDRIYRWGGEEFIVVLMGASIKDAKEICERLSYNVSHIVINEVKNITVSMGLTQFIQNDNYDSIVKRADDALYQAKNTGRNKVVIG